MKNFLVFQNKSYNEERKGGYLWAPQKNKNGQTFFHWENMTKVKEGDIIFSSYNREIVSINIATSNCFEADRPSDLDDLQLWEKAGWMVRVRYNLLESPIEVSEHIDNIRSMLPAKYSPYNIKGRGSQGYLFEIPAQLAHYFVKVARVENLF